MKFIPILVFVFSSWVHAAEVIPVQPLETCFLCSSDPSMTLYWQGKDAKAVLIFIPGGEGYLGLKEGQTDHRYHFHQTLKRLTNPAFTSGNFDVVLLDSPRELSPRQPYPSDRASFDHLIRIESAIKFYKIKTGLPVWLMGHSNGGISLTEFVKYARKNEKMNLIAGIVASGIRNESYFDASISFPMLFLHHEQDGCSHTTPAASFSNYEKVKAFISAPIEFTYVTGGDIEPNDPCRSGHHMYFGSGDGAAKSIDAFMSKAYK